MDWAQSRPGPVRGAGRSPATPPSGRGAHTGGQPRWLGCGGDGRLDTGRIQRVGLGIDVAKTGVAPVRPPRRPWPRKKEGRMTSSPAPTPGPKARCRRRSRCRRRCRTVPRSRRQIRPQSPRLRAQDVVGGSRGAQGGFLDLGLDLGVLVDSSRMGSSSWLPSIWVGERLSRFSAPVSGLLLGTEQLFRRGGTHHRAGTPWGHLHRPTARSPPSSPTTPPRRPRRRAAAPRLRRSGTPSAGRSPCGA